jgi:ParB-like chromosome segregation protein Spo0J
MNVKTLPIDQVTPYWRNPRKGDRAIEAVAESIRRYGFNSPIVVDSEGVVIAGHTRLRAARKLGLEEVPVLVLSDLPAEKAKAYRIADNATGAIARWDYDSLAKELLDLESLDAMGAFFRDGEIAGLLSREDADVAMLAAAGDGTGAPQARLLTEVEVSCPNCGEDFRVDMKVLS